MTDVEFDRRDGVAVVTLSRPDRLNAVTPALVEDLHKILDELHTDTETRVVVLTGAGRAFCSGMDVQGGGSVTSDEGRLQRLFRGITRGGEVVAKLREIPQPVIGALHGPVAGMGITFALACDLRVADPTVKFVAPFVNIGLSGGDIGLSWLLPRAIGPAKAAEILYRAQTLTAEQIFNLGMITEMAEEGGDLDAALQLAAELLGKSPYGLRHTKELLNLSLDAPGLRQHLAVENRTQTMAFFTEDFAEGLVAAAEKRPPKFRNR